MKKVEKYWPVRYRKNSSDHCKMWTKTTVIIIKVFHGREINFDIPGPSSSSLSALLILPVCCISEMTARFRLLDPRNSVLMRAASSRCFCSFTKRSQQNQIKNKFRIRIFFICAQHNAHNQSSLSSYSVF